jgi:hypothetical protein
VRRVLMVVLVLLGVSAVVGGGTWWAGRTMVQALDTTAWTSTAVDPADVSRIFGVSWRQAPARYESRQPGQGDVRFEVLLWFADEPGVAQFLADNHLAPSDGEADVEEALERLGGGVMVSGPLALQTRCCTGVAAVLKGRRGSAVLLQSTEREEAR